MAHPFVEGPIHAYITGRNLSAIDGSSILSPHFRFGTLSARTAVHAAMASLTQGRRVSRPDVFTWIDELVWRDFSAGFSRLPSSRRRAISPGSKANSVQLGPLRFRPRYFVDTKSKDERW